MDNSWQVHRDFPLRQLNSFGFVANAQFFCRVRNLDELKLAIAYCQQHELNLRLLGGGSNLVLGPVVTGLVCKVDMGGIGTPVVDEQQVQVSVGAGVNWHEFVRHTLGRGWYGLETLCLIPGQVGAAPIQNIGAYGTEVGDRICSVDVYDRVQDERLQLSAQQCEFGYRTSLFKTTDRYVVLAVSFMLDLQQTNRTQWYPDIAAELARVGVNHPNPGQVAQAVIRVRRRKLPDPRRFGNAGSMFKNPVVPLAQAIQLQSQKPSLSHHVTADDGYAKLSAAQLIDQAGWKGVEQQGLMVWPQQPLVMVNASGQGNGVGLRRLTDAIAADVASKFSVQLELEPLFVDC